jgi:hypothetical protein
MSTSWITRTVGVALCAVAVWGASVGGVAAANHDRQSHVPQNLVGTWGKTITSATWKKNHITYEPGGHWAITIAPGGLVKLYSGNDPTTAAVSFPFTTMHAVVSGKTFTVGATADGHCAGTGTYHWVASASKLGFTAVKDACAAREVLMTTGAFTREH